MKSPLPVRLREILRLGFLALACLAGEKLAAAPGAEADGWRQLSLREKIGQTMIMLPDRARELELGHGSLRGFFERYPVGGLFLGWKLFDGVKESDRTAVMHERVREYREASRLPLLFQQDYESGVSLPGLTTFPDEMAVGAAHSEGLAYDYGTAIARESRSVGVNWVLQPVADLNLNPLNPIDNIRSVSDDPDLAIRLLRRQIAGLQEHGVAATIKHFPGDGVDYRDQHLLTTANPLPLERWRRYHGRVFQALIDAGVDVVMPGHITLPAYQREKLNGQFPPATLSRELLTDLLKGQMKFKGVVISDAMVMGGFRGWYPTDLEGEIQSFLAGTDVLLWPGYDYLDEMERRIRRGEIPLRRLDDAVARIWALKRKLGLFDPGHQPIRPLSDRERAEAEATARAICEQAVTLVRDRHHALPLDPTKDRKLLLLGVAPISHKGGQGGLDRLADFKDLLQKRGFTVDYQHDLLYETQGWTETLSSRYDRIIVLALRSPHSPYGTIDFYDDEAQTVWGINAMPKDKVIVVSLGSPYLGGLYFERVDTYINAYSNTPRMHEAVVAALLGEIAWRGRSPVSLAGPRFAY